MTHDRYVGQVQARGAQLPHEIAHHPRGDRAIAFDRMDVNRDPPGHHA